MLKTLKNIVFYGVVIVLGLLIIGKAGMAMDQMSRDYERVARDVFDAEYEYMEENKQYGKTINLNHWEFKPTGWKFGWHYDVKTKSGTYYRVNIDRDGTTHCEAL